MPSNPNLINTLLRLQPGANRVTLPDGSGFDDDLAQESFLDSAQPADPLGALRGSRKNELTERIFNEKRAPNRAMPGNLDALNFLMRDIEAQEAEDPFQQQIAADRQAELSGFPSSQAASQYGQGLEEAKISMPFNVAQATAQGRVQEAGVRGRTAVDQARTQGEYGLKREGLIQDTRKQGFEQLGQFMGQPGDGRSRSMSVPQVGAVSVGAERPGAMIPAALQTNLMNARREFDRTGNRTALDQAIANVVQSAPVSETSKQWAHTIATNPQLSAMPLDEIIRLHEDRTGDVLEAQEILELRNLLSQVLMQQQESQ